MWINKVSSKHCFEAHGKATMTWFEVVDRTDEVSIYLQQGEADVV
ncbi:hypothetical protein [Streptococcus pneumoniae]|nr:hypothetical protein [Streptococcus pneumoniae]